MENQKNKRRPSGFETAGQARKSAPAPDARKKAAPQREENKPRKARKEKKSRAKRESAPRKARRIPKVLAAIAAALLVIFILIVLIFGGEKTIHQMPKIERRSTESFTMDTAPVSSGEVS